MTIGDFVQLLIVHPLDQEVIAQEYVGFDGEDCYRSPPFLWATTAGQLVVTTDHDKDYYAWARKNNRDPDAGKTLA